MIRRLAPLLLGAEIALGAGGCASVFGLDDYALGDGGGATASSTGAGDGGSSSTSSGKGGSSSEVTSSSGSGGGTPEDCRCIPEVPEGWTLVTAQQTTMAAPPAECAGDRRVSVGEVEAECACTCEEVEATCAPTLRCWEQPGCDAGPVQVFELGPECTSIGQRRSCRVEEGATDVPSCLADGVVGPSFGDAFDLCVATVRDARDCSASERCADAPQQVELCIEGSGSCPDGWDSVEHPFEEVGDFTCDACTCPGRTCAGARFRAHDAIACQGNLSPDFGAPGCVDVTNILNNPAEQAKLLEAGAPAGTCEPTEPLSPATYLPGAGGRLCCLPPL